jgi:uncharacterized BrkB/YihY/UPF0761 family membrane protein
VEREVRAGGGLIAGGVAYRLFLWLVPFGLVMAALLGFWLDLDPEGAERSAKEFGIGAAAVAEAAKAVDARTGSRAALLVVGLVLLAWFTLGAVRALKLASAFAWGMERPRLRRPLHSIVAFNGLILAATLSFTALAWLRETLGLGALLAVAGLLTLHTGLALLILWLLPRRTDRWQDLLPGALVVAVGAELIHVAVVFYFVPKLERSSELYGALGTATVLLVWLYVFGRLLTSAAFLNSTVWERRRSEPPAPA